MFCALFVPFLSIYLAGDLIDLHFHSSIYTGSIANPDFKDIYAPLDGVVVNAGIKIKIMNWLLFLALKYSIPFII
jgi:hypothetical protein